MAMNVQSGPPGRISPQMNVTPLVDVVLVLLIIFMVVTPLLTKSFGLTVPKKPDDTEITQPLPEDAQPLVLRLAADGTVRINSDVVAAGDLITRLQQAIAVRNDRLVFFDAADDADYGVAVTLMDTARGAGARTIAVLPDALLN